MVLAKASPAQRFTALPLEEQRSTFESNQVPVLILSDVEDAYSPGKFEVNPMDAHPNQAVHRAIAERLSGWLEAELGEPGSGGSPGP